MSKMIILLGLFFIMNFSYSKDFVLDEGDLIIGHDYNYFIILSKDNVVKLTDDFKNFRRLIDFDPQKNISYLPFEKKISIYDETIKDKVYYSINLKSEKPNLEKEHLEMFIANIEELQQIQFSELNDIKIVNTLQGLEYVYALSPYKLYSELCLIPYRYSKGFYVIVKNKILFLSSCEKNYKVIDISEIESDKTLTFFQCLQFYEKDNVMIYLTNDSMENDYWDFFWDEKFMETPVALMTYNLDTGKRRKLNLYNTVPKYIIFEKGVDGKSLKTFGLRMIENVIRLSNNLLLFKVIVMDGSSYKFIYLVYEYEKLLQQVN